VNVVVEDDWARIAAWVGVCFRSASNGSFRFVAAPPNDQVTLRIPPDAGHDLEYFVRAIDGLGNVLADAGSPTLPIRFQPPR
jgi:hypothetical protein